MDIYYIDGEFVPADQACIPVNDLAVLRGYGVFDFLRTYDGRPFHLDKHIHRLEASARRIRLDLPWTGQQIADVVVHTLEKNDHKESGIRIVVTGGASPDFLTPQGKPRLLVLVTALAEPPEEWYEKGVRIITYRTDRFITDAKSINYLPATLALKQARSSGAVEAVYMDRHGNVQEGTTSNIFAFIGDALVTPGKGILSGITRQVALEVARPLFSIQIRDLKKDELVHADEVFFTGTSKGIVPVVGVDGAVIGSGVPGLRTRKMMAAFRTQTERYGKTDTAGSEQGRVERQS